MTHYEPARAASRRRITRGHWALAVWAISFAAIWTAALPEIGSREELLRDMRRLESRGIDPRALFYDELDSMRPTIMGKSEPAAPAR